jgi:hypothetical protein
MATRRVSIGERRARLGVRHSLATGHRADRPRDVVESVVALHATDPASVYLSTWARADGVEPADVSRALYDERELIRMLGMRRTMFVVATTTAPTIQHSSTDVVAARLRRDLVKDLATVVDEPDRWLRSVEDHVAEVLREQREATAVNLSKAEPRLRTSLVYAESKAYGGPVNITSRVLTLMAAEGRIVRGRPGDKWNSSQYRWSPIEHWLPDGLPKLPAAAARADLLRRWLWAFGPGTVADMKWWTGWTLGDVRKALADVETVDVEVESAPGTYEPGLLLAVDAEPVPPPEPWIALLPALDPTPMGWTGRDWYLDANHRAELFDRNGNIGPTIWSDGAIVGGWAQRSDGDVAWELFTDVGSRRERRIASLVAQLTKWMSDVRVIPRFPTPLEKRLRTST